MVGTGAVTALSVSVMLVGGAGLDVAEVEAGAVGFESVGGEGGFGGVEVEVGPGDAEEFAGAQAGDRDDECGVECGAFSSGDEVSGLLGGTWRVLVWLVGQRAADATLRVSPEGQHNYCPSCKTTGPSKMYKRNQQSS